MFNATIKRFAAACAFILISQQPIAAQEVAMMSASGSSINPVWIAGQTWRASSSGRGGSHVAHMSFTASDGQLTGGTITWPNSGNSGRLVIQQLTNKKLVATVTMQQRCGPRTLKYTASKFNQGTRQFRLTVTGPRSKCRGGTIKENGKMVIAR